MLWGLMVGDGTQSSNKSDNNSYAARFSMRLDRVMRQWTADGRQISKPLKTVFLLVLVVVIAAFTAQNLYFSYRNLEEPLLEATESAQKLLQHQKAIGTSGLEQTLLGISANSGIVEAVEDGISDRIRDVSSSLLEEMKTFHDVTQFTIYNADLSLEYHVHQPGLFERAEKTHLVSLAKTVDRVTRGFELTDTGQMAIAAVRPLKANGNAVGFAKLSMDLRRPLALISSSLNADVIEIYHDDHVRKHPDLTRGTSDWMRIGPHHFQLAGSGKLPDRFPEILANSFSSNSLVTNSFVSEGRLKTVFSTPLYLADGRQISTLVLIHDITDRFLVFARSAALSLLAGVLLAALCWFAFNRLIHVLQRSIHETRDKLEQEVATNNRKMEFSRNRLIEAQKIASIGSWERNLTTGFRHWSEEMYRIVGLPTDTDVDVAYRYFRRQIPHSERAAIDVALYTSIDECSEFDFEHRIVRRNGEVRFLRTRGYVLPDENGQAARVIGTMHDITDWHVAQEQNRRLAGVLEASLNEIYIFDAGTFLFQHVNRCARENLGYSMEEFHNLEAWTVAPGYTRKHFSEFLAPLISGETNLLSLDGVLKRKDGSQYPVEVRLQLHEERSKSLVVAIVNDISERISRERELLAAREDAERIAYYDALTTLANRACCQREAEEVFSVDNDEKPSFLIHLDLDNFKRINDTLGHSAGDACLEEVGERLKMCCTGLGKAYRWGGDEFVIIADGPDVDSEELCERLNVVMRAPMEFEGNQIWPSVSMGVASCPEDGDDFGTLLVHADLALYRSKDNGKDRWCHFTSDMKIDSDEEARMDQELRQAIRNDEFFLVFQPQVNIRTHRVTGIEALVRWQHPTRGVLGPGVFLPVIEKSNLASTLGDIVINKALAAARSWQDTSVEYGRIAVNLSPSHLTSGTLLHDFNAAMERHGVGPDRVTAEVLESVFLDSGRSDNAQVLEELHRIGVHIELDDFGTGYASLSHVADLPINGLKIDRSFTAQILDDERKEIVVNQLIHLARSLNIGLICEGVETEAQINRLQMMGDFSVQGYLIARPMTYEAITDWLSETSEDLVSVV